MAVPETARACYLGVHCSGSRIASLSLGNSTSCRFGMGTSANFPAGQWLYWHIICISAEMREFFSLINGDSCNIHSFVWKSSEYLRLHAASTCLKYSFDVYRDFTHNFTELFSSLPNLVQSPRSFQKNMLADERNFM